MKLAIISNLHLDFHRDLGKELIEELSSAKDIDALIIAGDVSAWGYLEHSLRLVCDRFNHTQIIYVHGNHEFYGSSKSLVTSITKKLTKEYSNLHWLGNKTLTLQRQRFVGATLWFPEDPLNIFHEHQLNDFRHITDFRSWVYEENKKTINFFNKTIKPGDIVITHHAPSERSIHEKYKRSDLNRFFVGGNLDNLMITKKPSLWIHGHMHNPCDYHIGETQVICNPFGYPTESAYFQELKIIEM